MNIATPLIKWYLENKRDLPWRETQDPYFIWVSEIILQQTRVAQGLAYFERFTQHFPQVKDLANASETEVLRLWQGLGYYSRARNMHKAAQKVMNEFQGIFPTDYHQLLNLPGIGPYTAAAISSFSSNAPYAVVDGNVYRVLARLFAIDTPIDSTAGKKLFATLAQEMLDKQQSSLYNQAMMDFGAIQCTPLSPKCESCPFIEVCEAFRLQRIGELPIKAKKIQQKTRNFWYLDLRYQNHTYLHQRTGKDIWQGLYEYPLLEGDVTLEQILALDFLQGTGAQITHVSTVYKHVLSHQIIEAQFVEIQLQKEPSLPTIYNKVIIGNSDLPVSRLMLRYWEDIHLV